MLDSDLAKLYGVDTKVLNQAVKRNISRFFEDFMFQLNKDEFQSLRSQFVTSNGKGSRAGVRYMPYVITEISILSLIILNFVPKLTPLISLFVILPSE